MPDTNQELQQFKVRHYTCNDTIFVLNVRGRVSVCAPFCLCRHKNPLRTRTKKEQKQTRKPETDQNGVQKLEDKRVNLFETKDLIKPEMYKSGTRKD